MATSVTAPPSCPTALRTLVMPDILLPDGRRRSPAEGSVPAVQPVGADPPVAPKCLIGRFPCATRVNRQILGCRSETDPLTYR